MKLETQERVAVPAAQRAGGSCVVADAHGRILAVGDGWLAARGLSRQDVVGRALAEVAPDDAVAAAAGDARGDTRFLVIDAERERLAAVLMQLPAPFALVAGAERVVELCNDRLLHALGRGELLGRAARDVLPAPVAAAVERTFAEGAPLALADEPLTRRGADGALETRRFELHLEPLRAPDGVVGAVVLLLLDVTAARAARPVPAGGERLGLAFSAAKLGAWQIDLPSRALRWDDNLRRQLGIDEGVPADLDRFYARVHPDDRERTRRATEAAITTGVPCDVEYRVVRPGGDVRHLRALGRTELDVDGNPRRFDGVTIDVTERRRAEQALAQARDQLAIIIEAIGEGVIAYDAIGRCVFCNEAGARLAGFGSAAEMVGASRDAVTAAWEIRDERGELVPRAELPISRAFAGERVERVLRIRGRTGDEERWVLFASTPVRGPSEVELVVSVIRDFTERRRAEDAQHFIAEASRVLGSSLDYESTLRTVAQLAVPHLADWCAVEMKTATGSQQLAVAHVDPAKVDYAWELHQRYPAAPDAPMGVPAVLRTGKPEMYPDISDEMLVATAKDAEHLRIGRELGLRSAIVVPITGSRGTVGAITLVSAESGRRYGERELQLAMELAGRAALAIDNSLLYVEAQRAVRLRDDFLSVAGHELRTPLTALQLQLQGLVRTVRRTPTLPPDQVASRLEKASAHVGRLERLINELLDVSRITTGRLVMHPEAFDLVQLAGEVIDRFGGEAERAHVAVSLRAPVPVVGRWDRMRADQVLTNLLSNAIKYGAGHPVEVEITAVDGAVRLHVRDHGIGISPADQRRIFGRFERAVSERHYGGLGLGLWIVRQIVEAQGGSITVTSQPGVETTFTVELPR